MAVSTKTMLGEAGRQESCQWCLRAPMCVQLASYLEGSQLMWMWLLHLNSDDDDDDQISSNTNFISSPALCSVDLVIK